MTIQDGRTLAVITMRADFFDRLSAYPALAPLFTGDRLFIVTDMTPDNLRASITRPAEVAGLLYYEGLVEHILEDVRQQPGSMPLLQFALKELFERREGRRLTNATYAVIGGVRGALARHAEDIYTDLDAGQQALMRRVLLRLIEVSETGAATRRQVEEADLTFRDIPQEAVQGLLARLTAPDVRLLVANRDIVAEGTPRVSYAISHEALTREWARFRDWISADEGHLRLGGDLLKAANDWLRAGKHPDYLLTGTRLSAARDWLSEADASQSQRNFIAASVTHEETRLSHERRRQRNLTQARFGLVLAIMLILALSLVFVTVQSQQSANSAATFEAQAATSDAIAVQSQANLTEARITQARFLADLSGQQLEGRYYHNALLLALESLRYRDEGAYTPEGMNALMNALNARFGKSAILSMKGLFTAQP